MCDSSLSSLFLQGKKTKIRTTSKDGTNQVIVHDIHRDLNVGDCTVGDPKKSNSKSYLASIGLGECLRARSTRRIMKGFRTHKKSKLKIKPLMFNTSGVTDEKNAPTAAI